jgi:pyoverdine/dityrosine biosynthesis protein Dit1
MSYVKLKQCAHATVQHNPPSLVLTIISNTHVYSDAITFVFLCI